MAIQFARLSYVSRSTGGNACRKAAYNERAKIVCERTGEVFKWTAKSDLAHHEILLPEGVSGKFKESAYLWNRAEEAEKRKDSQVAKESVIALPDDKVITKEDRIELSRRYAQRMFVSKGLAAQIDIHSPHDGEKNWHAHILATTRGFRPDGEGLAPYKARETDPAIRKGYIKEEENPGGIWAQIQRDYFQEKGYALEVDPVGIVPQAHLGPVRMRAHLTEVVVRAELLREANEEAVLNPEAILQKVTEKSSVFRKEDIERFLTKFVEEGDRAALKDKIFAHQEVIQLYHLSSLEEAGLFTTKTVRHEEEKLLRFAKAVNERGGKVLPLDVLQSLPQAMGLTSEQEEAFRHVLEGTKGLALVQGRAGTGKSYTMNAIRQAYEGAGIQVMGLAPTHLVAGDMAKEGFQRASTVHKFLFDVKNGKAPLAKGSVVMVDEAAMVSNRVLIELLHVAKGQQAKVVLLGDPKQLSSVERGGMIGVLADLYGSAVLKEVHRQKVQWQKDVSEKLGEGAYGQAMRDLAKAKALVWSETKEEAMGTLITAWAESAEMAPDRSRLILAARNLEVDALNLAVRELRLVKGEISAQGYEVLTQRGREVFAAGDRVTFTVTDKALGIQSGVLGTLTHLNENRCVVALDTEKEVVLDPGKYHGLKLGYASTVYKAQGKTVDDVYVLQSPSASQKLSYVALSRQRQTLKVFVNRQETPSLSHLIAQVSRDDQKRSSLDFLSQAEVDKQWENECHTQGSFKHFKEALSSLMTRIKDQFHTNKDFYEIKPQGSSLQGLDSSVKVTAQGDLGKGDNRSLKDHDHQIIHQTLKTYRLESAFGKAHEKTLASIPLLKQSLEETNKTLGIAEPAHETLQKATFMALQMQKIATFPPSMIPDQVEKVILVSAQVWMAHKDERVGKTHGFTHDVFFQAKGAMKIQEMPIQQKLESTIHQAFKEQQALALKHQQAQQLHKDHHKQWER